MKTPFICSAVATAFIATGALAQQEDAKSAQSSRSSATGTPPPAIVLVPLPVASNQDFANGCWARLYKDQAFQGEQLSLVGPVDMPNMRTAFGTDWSGEFESLQVGPRARLTVYDNENYQQRVANFKSGQRVPELSDRMGFFEQIRSAKVACAGKSPVAEQSGGSSAAGGGSQSKR